MILVLYKDVDTTYYNSIMMINRSVDSDGDMFYSIRYKYYEHTNLKGCRLKGLKRRSDATEPSVS